jgi:hypothetical protein
MYATESGLAIGCIAEDFPAHKLGPEAESAVELNPTTTPRARKPYRKIPVGHWNSAKKLQPKVLDSRLHDSNPPTTTIINTPSQRSILNRYVAPIYHTYSTQ